VDFTTLNFLGFLALVALLYRLIPVKLRAPFLLLASYAFYWSWSGAMALLLLAATTIAYLTALAIGRPTHRNPRHSLAILTVAVLVLLLAFFKALPLLPSSLKGALFVPIGISYYTFKLISYVLDVYWETLPAERAFIPFAAYAAFFPQIVAGPIQRAESFLPQMRAPRAATGRDVLLGTQRILLGYFKKFVVADSLGLLVNFVYSHVDKAGTPLLLGYYAYPLQMYADFSGLTDIAIGAAWLLGIASPENFEAPFSAASPSAYWRRWHITLTTWLTDYVFTPLRMATRAAGDLGLVFSLTVNMVLIGIWHGFRWPFALFGLVHAIYLSVDALTMRARKKFYKVNPAADRITDWVGPLVTFHLVAIAFVFFGGENLPSIFYFLAHLGQGLTSQSPDFHSLIAASGQLILCGFAGYVVMEFADLLRRKNATAEVLPQLSRYARWSVYSCTAVVACLVILLLLASGDKRSPFLYAVF
jgi:alginate O-acetyltransferase complex protein AlgI